MTARAWMIAAVVLLGCGGADEATTELHAREMLQTTGADVAFAEDELGRYRVDIEQVTPDSGIETGFVIAYGYYITPPYRVEVRAGTTFVNTVPVLPTLSVAPFSLDSATWRQWAESERRQVERALGAVARALYFAYAELLAQGFDTAAAQLEIHRMAAADTLADSVEFWGNRGGFCAFGPEVGGHGKRWTSRGVIFGAPVTETELDSLRMASAKAKGTSLPQPLLTSRAASLRTTLEQGRVFVLAQGGGRETNLDCLRRVIQTMLDPSLKPEVRWRKLMMDEKLGYSAASCLVANRDRSLATWNTAAGSVNGVR